MFFISTNSAARGRFGWTEGRSEELLQGCPGYSETVYSLIRRTMVNTKNNPDARELKRQLWFYGIFQPSFSNNSWLFFSQHAFVTSNCTWLVHVECIRKSTSKYIWNCKKNVKSWAQSSFSWSNCTKLHCIANNCTELHDNTICAELHKYILHFWPVATWSNCTSELDQKAQLWSDDAASICFMEIEQDCKTSIYIQCLLLG